MKIASFNIENLFCRAHAMNLESWERGKDILAGFAQLNTILQNATYGDKDKQEIVRIIEELGLGKANENDFVILREHRGRLLKRSGSTLNVVAKGRGDWIGWVELKQEAVNEVATQMTAKVIKDVNADILAVVEAESRISLDRFNKQLLKSFDAEYHSIMLVEGNDERGINVGIMTKYRCLIESIVSHVDDVENRYPLFSRDCPEYTVAVNETKSILVLINHFKSKGYGDQTKSDGKRRAQAKRVREIYELRRSKGHDLIAVLGDFNDNPNHGPLDPLLNEGSDLHDISAHNNFKSDGHPGTYSNGTKSDKIDYILLSPGLFKVVREGGIFRKGVWGGKNGTLFPHYNEITSPSQAASDHAVIWADIDI